MEEEEAVAVTKVLDFLGFWIRDFKDRKPAMTELKHSGE